MIKLIKSTFYKEKLTKQKLIKFISRAKQLSFGSECVKFEQRFAKWQGRKYCVFLNSGSSANLAIIQALLNLDRIKKEDKVGFSAITWSTNVMPLIQLGLQPIPIDIEIETLNVSEQKLDEVLQKTNLRMLFLTNLLGFCDNIDKIRDLCKAKKIILIEDNCESLGTIYKNKKLGNYCLASTFSFYVGHHMSTIEGGAVCTDDENLATMLRIIRAHGWDRNLDLENKRSIRKEFKINSTFYARYSFYDLGYNLRPTEINGFIGNIQINFLDEIIQKRNANFMKMAGPIYQQRKIYYPIRYNHLDFLSSFAIPVIARSKKIRNELVKKCKGKVEIRPIVGGNIASQPFFCKYQQSDKVMLANAKLIHKQGLYFANNPELTEKEIKTIINVFS